MTNDPSTEPPEPASEKLGNDGLTDAERAFHADRWRNGAGKAPSREETARLRRLTLRSPVRRAFEIALRAKAKRAVFVIPVVALLLIGVVAIGANPIPAIIGATTAYVLGFVYDVVVLYRKGRGRTALGS